MTKPAKNTICLWYDGDAEDAARFYAKTFPDSSVDAVHLAPGDYPSGKKGDVLTVEFTVMGIPCLGLNGGPEVKHNWAFSFQVATADQAETDRYWNAIVGNGGEESARKPRGTYLLYCFMRREKTGKYFKPNVKTRKLDKTKCYNQAVGHRSGGKAARTGQLRGPL